VTPPSTRLDARCLQEFHVVDHVVSVKDVHADHHRNASEGLTIVQDWPALLKQ
jgi:hypothetical protein